MPESLGQMPGDLIPQRVAARPRLWQRTTAAVQRVFRKPVWLLGVAGLGLLVAGVIRIVAISNGAGLVTVVVAGAVLLVSPFIIARVQRFSVSSMGFDLQLARD